jgi:hypothetical protein
MIGISKGTKVHADIGGRLVPAVVLFHSFASTRSHDLYHLRIAEFNPITQTWHFSDYGPVQSHKLTRRETHIPGLDQEERKPKQAPVPGWVRQLQD